MTLELEGLTKVYKDKTASKGCFIHHSYNTLDG